MSDEREWVVVWDHGTVEAGPFDDYETARKIYNERWGDLDQPITTGSVSRLSILPTDEVDGV